MNSLLFSLPFRSLRKGFAVAAAALCASLPLSAPAQVFTAPTVWSFESLQNSESEWWRTLRVHTVPGVVYSLEQSNSLETNSWTTISTHYGMGAEWICPLFPGSEPVGPPSPGAPVVPSGPPMPIVSLVLEVDTSGNLLLSWKSLDDGSPRRQPLAGVTPHPVWEEFEGFYLHPHEGYFFAISPRFHTPVNPSAAPPPPGSPDTAMVAAFLTALPAITANIEASVATAAYHTPVMPNPENASFYRVHADWQVDSDGDSRYDWQELILDGSNPFAADSDGDGIPDQAANNNAALPTPPEDGEIPAQPLALVEQIHFNSFRIEWVSTDPEHESNTFAYSDLPGISGSLEGAGSFATFNSVVSGASIPPSHPGWSSFLQPVRAMHERTLTYEEGYGRYFVSTRCAFRLKLEAPAPPGGYRIPLRVGIMRQALDQQTNSIVLLPTPEGEEPHLDLMLEIAGGETIGEAVDLPIPDDLGQNRHISFLPAYVSLRETEVQEGTFPNLIAAGIPKNGICVRRYQPFHANLVGHEHYYLENAVVRWQSRRLLTNGTLTNWDWMRSASTQQPYQGHIGFVSGGENSGIHQMRAVLILPNGEHIYYPYLRMRDAKSIRDSEGTPNELLRAGQPDYFGVCLGLLSKAIRDKAVSWLGSTQYAADQQVTIMPGAIWNPNTKRSPKCNIFVTHVANSVGAYTPYYFRRWFIPTAPIAKDDWYTEPELNINLDPAGWAFHDSGAIAHPGNAVASPRTASGTRHGHVGILDYDGSWINAGSKTVNKSLHLLDESMNYKPNNTRVRNY